MKVKVIERFIDKETKLPREVDSEFDCDEKRLKEIQAAGRFVEIVSVDEKEKPKHDSVSVQGAKLNRPIPDVRDSE